MLMPGVPPSEFYGEGYCLERTNIMSKTKSIIAIASIATASIALCGFAYMPHDVTYYLYGGHTTAEAPETVTFTDSVTLPSAEKEYSVFTGWRDESGQDVDQIRFASSDLKLYAQYVPEYYPIHFSVDDNMVTTSMYKHGSTTDLMDFAKKKIEESHPYEDLSGWQVEGTEDVITAIPWESAGDLNLSAVFAPKQYNITYELNGGTNADNPASYSWGTGVESFTDPVRDGYNFLGWFSDPDCSTPISSISADSHEDMTLYAGWEEIPVPVYVPAVGTTGSAGYTGSASNVSAPAAQAPAVPPTGNYASIPQIGYTVSIYDYYENLSNAQAFINLPNTALFNGGGWGQELFDHAYQGLDSLPYRIGTGAECIISWNGVVTTYHYTGTYKVAPNRFGDTAWAIQSHALTVETCVGDGNHYYVFFD